MREVVLLRNSRTWVYSVQKTLQGCDTNIGSKISLLLYEWPVDGSNFGPKPGQLLQWVTFSLKIGIWVYFEIFSSTK